MIKIAPIGAVELNRVNSNVRREKPESLNGDSKIQDRDYDDNYLNHIID